MLDAVLELLLDTVLELLLDTVLELELGADENVRTKDDVLDELLLDAVLELLEGDELLEESDELELEEQLEVALELLDEVTVDELELGLDENTNTNEDVEELELAGEENVRTTAEDPDVGAVVVVASLLELEELGADEKVKTKDDA